MKKETLNIFVSHFHDDSEYIPRLKGLLEQKGYTVRDSSIDESEPNNAKNPDYIKSLIRAKIDWAGQVIVLIGPKTHERPWVNWEIEYAGSYCGKRVIGIFLRGATDADLPEAFEKFGDALIPWNSDKLEAVIEDEDIWCGTKGSIRPDEETERIKCR